jgi:hypothetical protein
MSDPGFVKIMPLDEWKAIQAQLKAQQAVIDAARAYDTAITQWLSDVGETEPPLFMAEYQVLHDTLKASAE